MPHVILKLASGRSEQTKTSIAEAIAKAIVANADCTDEAVSVSVEDVEFQAMDGESLQAGHSRPLGPPLQNARLQSPLARSRVARLPTRPRGLR